MILIFNWDAKMTASDKTFYKALGATHCSLSAGARVAQTQLAEELGIAQLSMAHSA